MPIQTNFAVETALHHVAIPATKEEVRQLNAIWNRQPPRNGRLTAMHTKRGLVLKITKPVVLLAAPDGYWKLLGRLVKRTGEPWWDICAVITDSEPQRKEPHAHALSLYRVTTKGEFQYLYSDTPEALWPEQYPKTTKRRRTTKIDGDAAWDRILKDASPRPSLSRALDEAEAALRSIRDASSPRPEAHARRLKRS